MIRLLIFEQFLNGRNKLSDYVIEQIKDFDYLDLTQKQKSLIDELILNEELKEHYIEYLAKGGFGTTYKAIWKDDPFCEKVDGKRNGKTKVALKCLHNSQGITAEFFNELESNIIASGTEHGWVVRCFAGMINCIYCAEFQLVLDIHNCGLIHHDLHCGNLLSHIDLFHVAYITDLGLCQPPSVKSSQDDNKKIYGVLPYVAPEVLRGKEYTQARLRPKSNYKIPQLIVDIILQCWDADPSKRPKANKLWELIHDLWWNCNKNNKNSVIHRLINEIDEINKNLLSSTVQSSSSSSTSTFSHITHSQVVYTSRLLDFKNLPEPKNADNNDEILGIEYSESLRVDFTKLDINFKGQSN
ncbi:hypothetical protein RclHR1_09750003 [Rhizophagus clarus]|uniref:Protein kinase domain-containing protein n=1 Tax=Rhizophagus clarus TaxID=94130 RepID=A0A2Z6S5M5_9GLOM|nr:hypothetical protein RclHR1_09750003 [Rhizophagus clarus]